ncbi:hypothetical protein FRC06_003493 [Ceratobasidium sp. 370]|nr:hypothetical protein FRC06_003493 [Ceratobasidium sp. 370]
MDAAFAPTYYKIIKQPTDPGTMRKKLGEGDYPNAHAFHNGYAPPYPPAPGPSNASTPPQMLEKRCLKQEEQGWCWL